MAEAAAPLLELRAVTKVYGAGEAAVHALRGIDLKIERGWIEATVAALGAEPRAAAVQGWVLQWRDPQRFDGCGLEARSPPAPASRSDR